MRLLNSHIFAEALTSKIIPVLQLNVLRNQYAMEDDWFQIGQISKEGDYYMIKEAILKRKYATPNELLLLEHVLYLTSG